MILENIGQAIKAIFLTVKQTIFTIPIRIFKRLNGNQVGTYSFLDFGSELFKLWILLLIGTALGLPAIILSIPAYLMLAIFAEIVYVGWNDAVDFFVSC
jgi:hypothetical protein